MIWPLFSIAKAQKPSSFFLMKANLSQNLALKLAPNDNYFTEELRKPRLWGVQCASKKKSI